MTVSAVMRFADVAGVAYRENWKKTHIKTPLLAKSAIVISREE